MNLKIEDYKVVDGLRMKKSKEELAAEYQILIEQLRKEKKDRIDTFDRDERKARGEKLRKLGGMVDKILRERYGSDYPDYSFYDIDEVKFYEFLKRQEDNGKFLGRFLGFPAEIGKGRERAARKEAERRAKQAEERRKRAVKNEEKEASPSQGEPKEDQTEWQSSTTT